MRQTGAGCQGHQGQRTAFLQVGTRGQGATRGVSCAERCSSTFTPCTFCHPCCNCCDCQNPLDPPSPICSPTHPAPPPSLKPSGVEDPASLHGSCPTLAGEKWSATRCVPTGQRDRLCGTALCSNWRPPLMPCFMSTACCGAPGRGSQHTIHLSQDPLLLLPPLGSRWIHVGPFQPQGAAKGCTDSDEKCEEWAVLGECEWPPPAGLGWGRAGAVG